LYSNKRRLTMMHRPLRAGC